MTLKVRSLKFPPEKMAPICRWAERSDVWAQAGVALAGTQHTLHPPNAHIASKCQHSGLLDARNHKRQLAIGACQLAAGAQPTRGVIQSLTKALTRSVKAAPTTMPTAMSTTYRWSRNVVQGAKEWVERGPRMTVGVGHATARWRMMHAHCRYCPT